MNAFTSLKNDREKVAGIMDKIEGTTERALKTREELFAQLKTELDFHAKIGANEKRRTIKIQNPRSPKAHGLRPAIWGPSCPISP